MPQRAQRKRSQQSQTSHQHCQSTQPMAQYHQDFILASELEGTDSKLTFDSNLLYNNALRLQGSTKNDNATLKIYKISLSIGTSPFTSEFHHQTSSHTNNHITHHLTQIIHQALTDIVFTRIRNLCNFHLRVQPVPEQLRIP